MILDKIPRWMLRQLTRRCPKCHTVFFDLLLDSFSREKNNTNLCTKCKFLQKTFAPFFNFILTQYFDVPDAPGGMRDILSDSYVRKLFLNVINGIGKFGFRIPLVFGAPLAMTWNLTNLCNLRCPHCYQEADTHKLPNEVTTKEILSTIHQLAEYGVLVMLFGGGEPLMHPDIYKILRFTIKQDMGANLSTNGTLITEDVAQKIKKTGVIRVTVSIDGLEETHDKFRGRKGTFHKAVQGLKNLKAVGMETAIACTITKLNYQEVPQVLQLAKDLELDGFLLNSFVPVGRGDQSLDITPRQRDAVLRFLYKELVLQSNTGIGVECFTGASPFYARIAYQTHVGDRLKPIPVSMQTVSSLNKRLNLHTHYQNRFWERFPRFAPIIGACTIGTSYSCINPQGDVWPCTLIPMAIGNIRTDKFSDIWEKNPLLNKLRDRNNIKGPCRDCKFYTCRGCRARPYAYFGDMFGSDIACIYCQSQNYPPTKNTNQ
ncbi:MAG: radical SAM protein [Candidatus Helarchaeota archaeon]